MYRECTGRMEDMKHEEKISGFYGMRFHGSRNGGCSRSSKG